MEQSYWMLLATILLWWVDQTETSWTKSKVIVLCTGIGSAAGVFLVTILPFYPTLFFIVALTFASVYIGQKNSKLYPPAFVISFITLIALSLSLEYWLIPLLGILAATLIVIVIPPYYKYLCNKYLFKATKQLDRLNGVISACLLQADYAQTTYLFERRVHVQKNAFMQTLLKMSALLQENDRNMVYNSLWLKQTVITLQSLYAILLECSMVRWRVTDQSLFALCRKELASVFDQMHVVLLDLCKVFQGKQGAVDCKLLLRAIAELEENYQNVLQVVAGDPLVMLLFLDGLRAFAEKAGDIRGPRNEMA